VTPPKLLVQLSDTHVRHPGELAYGRVDTAGFLARAVQAVLRLAPPVHAVVVSGDLTDDGLAAEYAHFAELLAPLSCPVYLMPGNHDHRDALRRAFPTHAHLQPAAGGPYIQYAVDLGGMRLVTLDTVVPGAGHGELCAERLAWLDTTLGDDPRTPTIVAMHHPPFPTYIDHMDQIGLLRGAEDLARVIERHPQVQRIICGHVHRSIQVRWAGTVVMTVPSTAHQVCLDLQPGAAAAFAMEPPGFAIHAWTPDGPLVSHVACTDAGAGPYSFDD